MSRDSPIGHNASLPAFATTSGVHLYRRFSLKLPSHQWSRDAGWVQCALRDGTTFFGTLFAPRPSHYLANIGTCSFTRVDGLAFLFAPLLLRRHVYIIPPRLSAPPLTLEYF